MTSLNSSAIIRWKLTIVYEKNGGIEDDTNFAIVPFAFLDLNYLRNTVLKSAQNTN